MFKNSPGKIEKLEINEKQNGRHRLIELDKTFSDFNLN